MVGRKFLHRIQVYTPVHWFPSRLTPVKGAPNLCNRFYVGTAFLLHKYGGPLTGVNLNGNQCTGYKLESCAKIFCLPFYLIGRKIFSCGYVMKPVSLEVVLVLSTTYRKTTKICTHLFIGKHASMKHFV